MPQADCKSGPQVLGDGILSPLRLGRAGEGIVGDVHGHFYESSYRKSLFVASTAIAGVAPGTTLNATSGAFVLWNSAAAGGLNLAIKKLWMGYVSGTLGAGSVVLATCPQTVAPTATALTGKSTYLGGSGPSAGLAYSAATVIAAVPTIIRPSFSLGAFLATTAAVNPPLIDLIDDEIIVPPQTLLVVNAVAAAGTTPLVMFGMTWEEVLA